MTTANAPATERPAPAQATVKVLVLRTWAGASTALQHPATVLEVRFSQPPQTAPVAWPTVRAWNLAEPLWGIQENAWPHALLQPHPAVPGSAPALAWGQALVAATLCILRWARQPAWQGRCLAVSANGCHWRLALPALPEPLLRQAVQWAVLGCATATGLGRASPARLGFQQWLAQAQRAGLAPSTHRFFLAACQRGIPVTTQLGALRLGWGSHQQWLDSSFTGRTPNLAARWARSKPATHHLLAAAALPVPQQRVVRNAQQAAQCAARWGWPLVVKPSNQDQGIGVVPHIQDDATLATAVANALRHSPGAVVVERHVPGGDHRLLVVGGHLRVATRRDPAGVRGDGHSTLRQLVQAVNADPRRGTGKRSLLIALEIDAEALRCLREQSLQPDNVPAAGRFVYLRRTANISTGGTAVDVTAQVHPDNRAAAERAARILGLDIAGVDFLCPDIARSWREVGGAICEVNAQPGFRVHWLGDPARDLNGEVLDWLFPRHIGRIPTVAISGTNGKSTVAMMLHHIGLQAGLCSGVTTTAGTWVGHTVISTDNLSGQPGGQLLLNDPAVDVAVIEMPRKGLLLFGHPCDRYDVAALLNVQDDHIGADGIQSLDQMALLKAQVLQRASQAVVVNADDPRCLAMRAHASAARHILVSQHATQPVLQQHLAGGGQAVYAQAHQGQPWIFMAQGANAHPLMPLHDIPATMQGLLAFNQHNALFAVALAWAMGHTPEVMRAALASFHNSLQHNPGRYNFISGLPFELLVDFAHNPDGARGLFHVVRQRPVAGRRWLVNMMAGNRFKAHLLQVLDLAVPWFDHFVLSARPEVVTKSQDWAGDQPVANMLACGQQHLIQHGVPASVVATFDDPAAAIAHALAHAQPGDQVVMMVKPWVALPLVDQWRSDHARTPAQG